MVNSSKINKQMGLIENIDAPQNKKPSRDGFGKALVEIGAENPNLWVMTADVSESTRTHWFAEKYPDRFVQVGVSEQNLAGVAAGIASSGKTVFISAYGVFSPGRNWDQIRVSLCYNNVPVKLHGSHTGVTVGPDGASHQALEDIAITRVLPNMKVIVPADFEEARKATIEASKTKNPVYIRSCREKMPAFTTHLTPFTIGKANIYRDGEDVAIFACGPQVYESIIAAEKLESEGISCAVIDCHTIKPIDEDVGHERDHLAVVVFLKPRDDDRGVEPSGVSKNDFLTHFRSSAGSGGCRRPATEPGWLSGCAGGSPPGRRRPSAASR